jgi:hypothetical protein
MARIEVRVTKYGFKKPSIFSEQEFISYKQIFSIEPEYNIAPDISFWDEFNTFKWLLIAFILGLLLSFFNPNIFGFIPILSGFIMFFVLISGEAKTMMNYQDFLNEKNKYYNDLKKAIQNSESYNEFKYAFMDL